MSAFLQHPTTHHTQSPQLTSHLPEVLVKVRRHYLCKWVNYLVVIQGNRADINITSIKTTSGGASQGTNNPKGKTIRHPSQKS